MELGKNKELVELAETVLKELEKEAEEEALKLSITEGGKEGKSKVITSCRCLEEKLRECSKRARVVMTERVETLGEDRERETSSWERKKR